MSRLVTSGNLVKCFIGQLNMIQSRKIAILCSIERELNDFLALLPDKIVSSQSKFDLILWALRSPEICHGWIWLRAKAAIERIRLHYDLSTLPCYDQIITSDPQFRGKIRNFFKMLVTISLSWVDLGRCQTTCWKAGKQLFHSM